MSQTIEIPNNIPVSWLSRQETSDNDMLLLVSVPDSRTETEFMSKYMKYEDFYGNLRTDMKINVMQQWVDKLSREYAAILDNLSSNALCCATIPNPYIISALYQENGNITSLSGYRLSDGMDYLFQNVVFDQIHCRNLSATNIRATNLTATNVSASNLTANNSEITNLSVTTIVNTTNLIPSLYGYPLVAVDVDSGATLKVKNKCVNYTVARSDFFVVMEELAEDVEEELANISKDFELFVAAAQDCQINFNQFQFQTLTPNVEEEDVSKLEGGKAYLFIFSQVDPDTVYVNRQTLRSIEN